MNVVPLDLGKLKVYPLADRKSLTRADEVVIDPESNPAPLPERAEGAVENCARAVRSARDRGASVILIYGAHLLRNGAAGVVGRLMAGGWVTHVATNGAGTIHDWEYAWLGRSTEGVRANVAAGTFGAWHETSNYIHMALMSAPSTDSVTAKASAGSSPEGGRPCRAPTNSRARSPTTRDTPSPPPEPTCSVPRSNKLARRPGSGRAPLSRGLDPRASLQARHPRDGASGDRVRHHRQPPGLQRGGRRPRGGLGFPTLRGISRRPG